MGALDNELLRLIIIDVLASILGLAIVVAGIVLRCKKVIPTAILILILVCLLPICFLLIRETTLCTIDLATHDYIVYFGEFHMSGKSGIGAKVTLDDKNQTKLETQAYIWDIPSGDQVGIVMYSKRSRKVVGIAVYDE